MSEADSPYQWTFAASPYTNSTDKFVVVVGANPVATQVDATNIIIVQVSGITIDAIVFKITTSGEAMEYMPRKMLVPPSGVVTSGGTNGMSIVVCRKSATKTSLENALAIL